MADDRARWIAKVLGPVLMVLTSSEALNLSIWQTVEPRLVYLNGLVLLTVGVAIVRTYNRWTWTWPVLVTVMGWLLAFAGAYRMFFPAAEQLDPGPVAYGVIGLLFLTGLVLTVASFGPSASDRP